MAAVYPRALCQSLVKNFQYFLQPKHVYNIYTYTCPTCTEGRRSLEEHTLMPGEKRHGPKLKLPVKTNTFQQRSSRDTAQQRYSIQDYDVFD
jgi:hypothetical protein